MKNESVVIDECYWTDAGGGARQLVRVIREYAEETRTRKFVVRRESGAGQDLIRSADQLHPHRLEPSADASCGVCGVVHGSEEEGADCAPGVVAADVDQNGPGGDTALDPCHECGASDHTGEAHGTPTIVPSGED